MPFKDYETLKVYQLSTTRVRFNILFSLYVTIDNKLKFGGKKRESEGFEYV